ncbi:MAG: type II toxin-antitoxin system VapC family toxin [Pseudomonadota bacterium]|jgi:predicted nucleic acid-binding protein
MSFVIDNSVVCGWLIESQSSPYAQAVAQRLLDERAIAPALLPLEYTNVLRTACKRQRLIASQAQEMLALLATLPIDIDSAKPHPAQLLDLALRYDLSSYDAVYLDLALRRRLPLATQDQALAHAAVVAGVGVVSA